ncbi:SUMF1/EgtB/PvdO family nonheme iron enzyme [Treponema sp. Marseille-Q3903]|uniref:formylglycine-generating enzyme family protein n=1 Tax=Treponema sp. Marseille-Q3903 TaxID=2766703 RepID=UPI001651E164|nr:SUMF1/EgtB/PvdO family nonheme iron enzyme [Treponema sp. Marseille-Q3903]MBC6712412.1 SUMF1/EgtB/PvdO family nonheme iron enzyme [Treponema sp. Marseille-Q3903]
MKKLIQILFLMNFSYLFFAIDFIKIPSTEKYNIGNNKFIYYEDYYKNNPTIKKYYCKEQDIKLSEFFISEYEITVKEVKNFIHQTDYPFSFYRDNYWTEFINNKLNENNSCALLNLYESLMFIQWYSLKKGKEYRLPSNAEWEYAAIHNNKAKLPYGNPTGIFKDFYVETWRYEIPVFIPESDCSGFGMKGVLGGSEIVLDNFSDEMYEKIDKLHENPLIFEDTSCSTIRSGDINYNQRDFSDRFGLYFHNHIFFNSIYGNEIRLVYAPDTIFNKGRLDECIWFQNRGFVKETAEIYLRPDTSEKKNILKEAQEVLILFKSTDNLYYRCYYKTDGNWNAGWILASQVSITNIPWYINPL